MVFNQKSTNDLIGDLRGHVLFAQNAIFPVKQPTEHEDIRPHLVSLRDTLLLFKPLGHDFDSGYGVKLLVSNKNKSMAFRGNMLPPDKLPRAAERNVPNGDEYLFLKQDSYDDVITSQDELSKISGNEKESYFTQILLNNRSVKIKTSDGKWFHHLYLPTIKKDKDVLTMVVFTSNAGYKSYIHFTNNRSRTFELKRFEQIIFINVNDKWDSVHEMSFDEELAIRRFVADKVYDSVIQGNDPESLMVKKTLRDDMDGREMDNILTHKVKAFGKVKFVIDNNDWPKQLYLPQNSLHHDGKFCTFRSENAKDSLVHYDLGILTLSQGETLIFRNKKGKWIEWSDTMDSKFIYGENFWSLKLPKALILPGIELSFFNKKKIGNITHIKIGAPTQLLLHTIDIGFLTPYRNQFLFRSKPQYEEEYFQMIPVSRLIVNEYEPISLDEVVLPSGITYTNVSSDNGGWHSGDMRQIGKALFSMGMNLANYGIHSATSTEAGNPYTCAQLSAHNSQGKYQNGVQVHGGSGGNGMVTLESSVGNEFSHELGHNYGLGHYPNGFAGSVHRSSEYFGSTWG